MTTGPAEPSPMMAQYFEIKKEHPHCLLFFRMGDFYELFFEDAEQAAPALDIALTKRGKNAGADIPMCGVPVVSSETYLHRLIAKGFRVAICEQTEDPEEARKRPGKPLVKRDVVRIVTAGTLTEEALLDGLRANHLTALALSHGQLALASVDVSAGQFSVHITSHTNLMAELERLQPCEILIDPTVQKLPRLKAILEGWEDRFAPIDGLIFEEETALDALSQFYRCEAAELSSRYQAAELIAAGTILDYLEHTQKGQKPKLDLLRRYDPDKMLQIDAATRRNLEILQSQNGERKGSLLDIMDETITHAGARLLAARLAAPSTDRKLIEKRLDQVEAFLQAERIRLEVRNSLRQCPDAERALSRISLERAGPRDLQMIGRAMQRAQSIQSAIAGEAIELAHMADELSPPETLTAKIDRLLVEQPPTHARDGGFIKPGVDAELDKQRQFRDDSRELIVALEADYRRSTGINTLKIKFNNLLGYFVEVTSQHRDKVPIGFVQRQSMANATRFVTEKLLSLGEAIGKAADLARAREQEMLADILREVIAHHDPILSTARTLAEIDVTAGLAELASRQRYCRPKIDDSARLSIHEGRHPVVELARSRDNEIFTANDCHLRDQDGRLWLLTGPNMAGKSTFLRQNALIVLMAQTGSFVPATRAEIGLVDRLFSRVGAADDLARGHSTFMVEMVETATILQQATARSMVILDEIGRGTATFDGLSIAWAVLEHLHNANRSRALFATHYHELTSLQTVLKSLTCHQMRVKEWRGSIVFLHEVAPGSADRSYGIHVAKLAGLPVPVIKRANQVLKKLESSETGLGTGLAGLPLFQDLLDGQPDSGAEPSESRDSIADYPSALEKMLHSIDPDTLTPKQALELIYELKTLSIRD